MVDNPLDRRALQSLEKQLQLEIPESHFDLSVSVLLMSETANTLSVGAIALLYVVTIFEPPCYRYNLSFFDVSLN